MFNLIEMSVQIKEKMVKFVVWNFTMYKDNYFKFLFFLGQLFQTLSFLKNWKKNNNKIKQNKMLYQIFNLFNFLLKVY